MVAGLGSVFIRRLSSVTQLSAADRTAITDAIHGEIRVAAVRRDLISEGDRPRGAIILLEGWCARYKAFNGERRQILSFLLPGDIVGLDGHLIGAEDHSIAVISPVRFLEIDFRRIEALRRQSKASHDALERLSLLDAAVQREWMVSLGQRSAIARLAHLLCETFARLRLLDRCAGSLCDLPLTQTDLADALGMTAIHANRMVQELRATGCIRWQGQEFEMRDMERLAAIAGFDPSYLHLGAIDQILDSPVVPHCLQDG